MTAKEYLDGFRAIKERLDYLQRNASIYGERATGVRSSLNIQDGIRTQRSGANGTEDRLIAYCDAIAECKKLIVKYQNRIDNIYKAIYNLYYWEGVIIERLYIYDVLQDTETDIMIFSAMLGTDKRQKIQAKINEALRHMQQILTEQGAL